MSANIRALVLGDALSAQSREQLKRWLVGNKTGDTALRAGRACRLDGGRQDRKRRARHPERRRRDLAAGTRAGHRVVYLTETRVPTEQRKRRNRRGGEGNCSVLILRSVAQRRVSKDGHRR
jgi:hypothetical protein